MTKRAPAKRPPIHMIDSEADTLTDLALARQDQSPALAELLLQEIDRAKIYTAAKIPADIVTMHSRVEFVDEGNGQSRTVELVYPVDADIAAGRISIMTPIGAGLIGMREGQSILWPDRDGQQRRLSIVKVTRSAIAG
ncbi:nucleoside diphosphate kinase regulator [Sphingopyxis panaciterrulae]|uniref:Regulator of nucleoside diphosphate kinase n=1 Tax=Sphingopyxis panaciterrulae TaxID=462372 RepID=A0A7W9B4F4_9SPHN|nr:nucleoside diphosphate kinase regulator [Sphingopyxis panaciterrulae]MBB5706038.1 regulator of nucleoside diphosphate kinase [Sphingopyxis panaciterrulae]